MASNVEGLSEIQERVDRLQAEIPKVQALEKIALTKLQYGLKGVKVQEFPDHKTGQSVLYIDAQVPFKGDTQGVYTALLNQLSQVDFETPPQIYVKTRQHPLRSALGGLRSRVKTFGQELREFGTNWKEANPKVRGMALAEAAALFSAILLVKGPGGVSAGEIAGCQLGFITVNPKTTEELINGHVMVMKRPEESCLPDQKVQLAPKPGSFPPIPPKPLATIVPTAVPPVFVRAHDGEPARDSHLPFVVTPTPPVSDGEPSRASHIPFAAKPKPVEQAQTPKLTPVQQATADFLNQKVTVSEPGQTAEQLFQLNIPENTNWQLGSVTKTMYVKEVWRQLAEAQMKETGKNPDVIHVGQEISPSDYLDAAGKAKLAEAMAIADPHYAYQLHLT